MDASNYFIFTTIPILIFFVGILYYISGIELERTEYIPVEPVDTDLRERLETLFRVKFEIFGYKFLEGLSINQLVDYRDKMSNLISALMKKIIEVQDNGVCEIYEHDKDIPFSLDEFDVISLKELLDIVNEYFNKVENELNQKQYDIFYYLNSDPSIPEEAKLYSQIHFIDTLPPDEKGYDGVIFSLHNKTYSARKLDHYFMSDSIRDYEKSVIQL